MAESLVTRLHAAPTRAPGRTSSTLMMGLLVAAGSLGTSSVAPALPSLASDLQLGLAATAAVVSAYTVSFASAAIVAGQLIDRLGARRVLRPAIAVAVLGVGLATAADTQVLLLAGRALQGVGASVAAIAAYSVARRHSHGLATVAAALTVGSAAGPLLGGVATEYLTWRGAVGLPTPLLLVGLIVSLPSEEAATRMDLPGTTLVAVGATATASGLQLAGHIPALTGVLLPTGLALLAMAGARSLHRHGTVPTAALLRDQQVRTTAAVAMACAATYFATVVIVPVGLGRAGWGPIGIGLLLLPGAVAGAWSSRRWEWTDRRLRRWTEPTAVLLIATSLLLVLFGGPVLGALSLTVLSAAFGMVQPRLMTQMSGPVHTGPATALGTANLVFLLGGGFGAALVGGLGTSGGGGILLAAVAGVGGTTWGQALRSRA